jgi:hypothetical protein
LEILRRFLSGEARRRPVEVAAWIGLVLLLLFAARTLTRSPCLGVADNGDFWRVMRPAGIEHAEPLTTPGRFVRCSFVTGEADLGRGFSSGALLAWLAKHLSWGISSSAGTMDLRQMGLLYLVLAVLVMALGLASKVPPLLALAVGYVLADPGYLLFFNSFYADSALFVAIVGLTLSFDGRGRLSEFIQARSRSKWIAIACLLLALVALGGASKGQYLLLPAVTVAALLTMFLVDRPARSGRVAFLICLLAVLSAAVSWHFLRGSGHRFPWANNYHAVYGGIVAVSDQPEEVFDAFGIPDEHRNLPRSDVFSAQIPPDHPVHRHLRGLSRPKLAWLYVSDPGALIKVAARIQHELASVETHLRGNRVKDSEHPWRSVYTTGWQYAAFRGIVFGAWPPVTWLVLGSGVLWLALSLRRRPASWPAILFLVLWTSSQLVVVILGDGLVSLKQHLVGARLGLDLLLILLLAELGSALARRYTKTAREA